MKSKSEDPDGKIKAPGMSFPGGEVIVANPMTPLSGVWVDVLELEAGRRFPAHKHEHVSSLLICVSGAGMLELDEEEHRLEKGRAAFIPAGAVHAIQADESQVCRCIAVNQGIMREDEDPDLEFREDLDDPNEWSQFADSAGDEIEEFVEKLKESSSPWTLYTNG